MKKILLLFVSVLIAGGLFAQIQLKFDDFEAYTAGSPLVQQATSGDWDTWSSAPGGAEDPNVSNAQAYNGSNSVNIVAGNDLIFLLDDKTTGLYQIEFYINVASGAVAYFNCLHEFAATSEWAMEVLFKSDGSGSVNAGGVDAAQFSYSHDAWQYINVVIDLDGDFATLFIDDAEVISWQWSAGAQGGGSNIKLDAVNIYGWTDDVASNFFIDDIEFTEQLPMEAPLNLQSTLTDDDVALTWEAPASSTPENYCVIKNGEIVATGLTTLAYDDIDLYPNTYTYAVKAYYTGLGYSASSNETSETLAGGIARDFVVFEIGTGTWCTYCPGSAMGADDLHADGIPIAIIENHNGDNYANAYSDARNTYYNVTGFPTSEMDGVLEIVGGSADQSLYPNYLPQYENRIVKPSVHDITLDIASTGGTSYTANVTVEETYAYFTGTLKLHAVLTESHIPENWLGQTEVNFVCRAMYPDENGTTLDFSSSSTQSETFNFDIGSYVKDNCEFIVFVQHDGSKEITNGYMIDLETIVSIDDPVQSTISVYPNPAGDYVRIYSDSKGTVTIYNVTGQVVHISTDVNSETILDVSGLTPGMYILNIETDKESMNTKLIIE